MPNYKPAPLEPLPPDFFLSTFVISEYYHPSRFRFRDEPFDQPSSLDDLKSSYTLQETFEPPVTLKALPPAERPRERLANIGADALSTVELLAILLGNGTKNCSALELAVHLMSKFGSLTALAEASLQELSSIKGIGFAKAVQLKAAFSLHARFPTKPIEKVCFDKAAKIFEFISPELRREKVEVLMVILLDARKGLIHRQVAAKGILNEILIHPREIFHLAIRHCAHSIVIAHNHPSGDPAPSQQDLNMTQILQKSGQILGIQLTDHLIIAGDKYFSLAENNFLLTDLPKSS